MSRKTVIHTGNVTTLAVAATGSILLITIAVAVAAPSALLAACLIGSGIVAAAAFTLVAAVGRADRATAETERLGRRAAALSDRVAQDAVVARVELDRMRTALRVGEVDDATRQSVEALVTAVESLVDGMDSAVRAASPGAAAPQDVTDVGRCLHDVVASGDWNVTDLEVSPTFAACSASGLETALRLVLQATQTGPDDRVSARVTATGDEVRVIVATDGRSAQLDAAREVCDPESPPQPFLGPAIQRNLALARAILRRENGELSYVRALGWANLVISLPRVGTPELLSEEPAILGIDLPEMPQASDETERSIAATLE